MTDCSDGFTEVTKKPIILLPESTLVYLQYDSDVPFMTPAPFYYHITQSLTRSIANNSSFSSSSVVVRMSFMLEKKIECNVTEP